MSTIQPYPVAGIAPQGIPDVRANVPAAGDLASFGGNQARDLQVAGPQLAQASDAIGDIALREMKVANDTRVQDLNNQYIADQQKLLFTNPDAFYRQKGEAAINASEPTTKALQQLRTDTLARAANEYQREKLGDRLDFHLTDATNSMSRHVAAQSAAWQDTVAKGTVTNAGNEAALHYNDPAKVAVQADGAYQVEYDRVLKDSGGSVAAATASATAVRSKILTSVIALQAVDNPGMAQRTLDASRDKLDAADAVTLSATIKDAALKRRSQDIVAVVGATGGSVSPNYSKKVPGAEGGSPFVENKIGALGNYQMTPQTYTDAAQSTDWGKGKTQAEIRTLLLDQKEGPARQDQLQGILQQKQAKSLSDAGIPVNDLTLYTTHFLGTGAGPALLKLPDDTPLQAGLLKAHTGLPGIADPKAYVDQVNVANPFLAKIETVGDLKAFLAQKIGAPRSLATAGTPEKPNLDAMLASGLVLAGPDPDLRDRVTQAIKTDYATKHAIYQQQIAGAEKQAFAHIDAGGTIESLPSPVRAALDADGLAKVQVYEEKKLEKRRKDNANNAYRDLTELERLGQLNPDAVKQHINDLPGNEYRSWQKIAAGDDRIDDAGAYERLQRGLGSRDMRDDIYAEHNAGNISNQSRNALLEKNGAFLKEGAPATPYKINHDMLTRSLDPGLMGSGISREIYGRAIKEFDQYVAQNPQRDGETPEQYGKRVSDFAEATKQRHQLINTQEMAISKPIPVNTPFNRGDMTSLGKPEATKKIAEANAALGKRYQAGEITEDQYNLDAIALMGWLNFVQQRPEPARRP